MELSQIVNQLIEDNNYTSYIEVGYGDGSLFNKIHCDVKIAIDENPRGDEFEEKLHYNSCYLREDGSLLLKEDPKDFFRRERDFKYDVIFLNDMEEYADQAVPLLSPDGIIIMKKCPTKLISDDYELSVDLNADILIARRK